MLIGKKYYNLYKKIYLSSFIPPNTEKINSIQINLLWIREQKLNEEMEKEEFIKHIENQKIKWINYVNVVFWHDFNNFDNNDDQIKFENIDKLNTKRFSLLPNRVTFFTRIDYIKNLILIYQMKLKTNTCKYIIFADLDVEEENADVNQFLNKYVANKNKNKKTVREALDTVGIIFAKNNLAGHLYRPFIWK